MLKLCSSFTVVVHLILLFHIAQTFVLLTANVDDVRKIARKFVSDELAEKISDFIARATESLSNQAHKTSEENVTDNSQVSAENKLYNVERHLFDGFKKDVEKTTDKNKAKTTRNKKVEADNIETKPKTKNTKTKSRYIVQTDQVSTTVKGKVNEDDKQKDSIKMIENNSLEADTASTKKPKQKKKTKVKPYKLLSAYSEEENAVKDGTGSKEEQEDKEVRSHRAFDDEIAAIRIAAQDYDDDGNKTSTKPLIVKDESEKYESEITNKSGKVDKSNSFVKGKNKKEDKWWEKDLPKHKQGGDANLNHKSWF